MQMICFEDSRVGQLNPIIQARPAYAVTCASLRLVDRLKTLVAGPLAGASLCGAVRSYLAVIQKLDYELDQAEPTFGNGKWSRDVNGIMLVNARLVPRVALDKVLVTLANETESCCIVDADDGSVLVARWTAADLARKQSEYAAGAEQPVTDFLVQQSLALPKRSVDVAAFHWPHDVVAWHMKEMRESIEWRLAHGDYTETADGVFVSEGVSIGQYAAINTDNGPILLEQNVKIGPFCYLEGPLYAGAGTRVIEHSAIKDGVSLGHTVKIGGEVEASIIEPYTNKQHHGFLGHSYAGSWINLGAGTCNSDLKNTYGTINIEYGETKMATGMQFLGCFIGDYSKSAINTSIFTGKVIGVCSMLYGFVTSNVPSFVNYARLFGQTALLPADVMINTQARMFARRNVPQRECDKQLILDMYRQTEAEREVTDQYTL
ncbi:Bifunctional protein GlmU [Novipirellula galeiformis]|uniref:Bifunctional protein GlmU n=1 Tax=Novipirellula galeiformis TaxID=2528004 RepID=A0A5C6CJU5_9BACT|nr:putative sugar nucleotidyl transferase [Novipirellula galeiformis]TWU24375.1 Bifunctional protein GlmU [Novipirellula galeiformis]